VENTTKNICRYNYAKILMSEHILEASTYTNPLIQCICKSSCSIYNDIYSLTSRYNVNITEETNFHIIMHSVSILVLLFHLFPYYECYYYLTWSNNLTIFLYYWFCPIILLPNSNVIWLSLTTWLLNYTTTWLCPVFGMLLYITMFQ